MSETPRRITHATLRVAADLGHGGPLSEYRIDAGADGYAVTVSVSSLGGTRLQETLPRDRRQVEAFLEKLSAELRVYELTDLSPTHPFLHPTFYTFGFRDSEGAAHGFEYRVECSNHLDERYARLVREFQRFFESERVFARFFEAREKDGDTARSLQPPKPPTRGHEL